MDPRRAKKYTIIMVVAATLFTRVSMVARGIWHGLLFRISVSLVYVSCAITMIICYTLMAAAMLNQVGMQNVTRSSKPGTSHVIDSTIDVAAQADDLGLRTFRLQIKLMCRVLQHNQCQ